MPGLVRSTDSASGPYRHRDAVGRRVGRIEDFLRIAARRGGPRLTCGSQEPGGPAVSSIR